LRLAAAHLRPFLDYADPTKEEIKKERLDRYAEAHNEFARVVNEHRPFYAPEIFEQADKIIETARKEAISYAHQDPHTRGYWEEARENIKINELINNVCEAIRKRIWSVSVIDATDAAISKEFRG